MDILKELSCEGLNQITQEDSKMTVALRKRYRFILTMPLHMLLIIFTTATATNLSHSPHLCVALHIKILIV
jgi:hypothetical protein